MAAGIPADHIGLSTQSLPADFAELSVDMGVERACSVSQLERMRTATTPVPQVGIRVNSGSGTGGFSTKYHRF
jgi:hypothetical protein